MDFFSEKYNSYLERLCFMSKPRMIVCRRKNKYKAETNKPRKVLSFTVLKIFSHKQTIPQQLELKGLMCVLQLEICTIQWKREEHWRNLTNGCGKRKRKEGRMLREKEREGEKVCICDLLYCMRSKMFQLLFSFYFSLLEFC